MLVSIRYGRIVQVLPLLENFQKVSARFNVLFPLVRGYQLAYIRSEPVLYVRELNDFPWGKGERFERDGLTPSPI